MSTFDGHNTFIFCFVRMNPPTPGHLILVTQMMLKAVELGVNNIYVLSSSTMDKKNPLPCSSETIPQKLKKLSMPSDVAYKQEILSKIIDAAKTNLIRSESNRLNQTLLSNLNVNVICSVGSPFGTINGIIKNNFIDNGITKVNLYFIVGRDRASFFDTIADYYSEKSFIGSIDGECLGRPGMAQVRDTGIVDTDISEMDPKKYSASFVRNLVSSNKIDDFRQVYGAYLSPDEVTSLYETIQNGRTLPAAPKKADDDYPPSKYFRVSTNPEEDEHLADPVNGEYEKIGLPTPYNKEPYQGDFSSGGKRRRRKSIKNRKTKRRKGKRHTRRYK